MQQTKGLVLPPAPRQWQPRRQECRQPRVRQPPPEALREPVRDLGQRLLARSVVVDDRSLEDGRRAVARGGEVGAAPRRRRRRFLARRHDVAAEPLQRRGRVPGRRLRPGEGVLELGLGRPEVEDLLFRRRGALPGAPRGAKRSYREMQAVCLALGDEEVVAQIREAADAAVGIDGSAE